MMKTVIFVHKWVGVLIGIFVFVSCFSGLMMLIGRIGHWHSGMFQTMGRLHHDIFLGETGRMILGSSTLLLIIEIVTGYLIWGKIAGKLIYSSVEHGRSAWKGFTKSLSWRRPTIVHGLHTAGGWWAGIPLLLMALTGLAWSFGWYKDLLLLLFNCESSPKMMGTLMKLHAGGWGSVISQILWAIFALVGVCLPVTGYMLTFRRRKK